MTMIRFEPGERVRRALTAQGRSTTWLAGQIGMHRSQLSRILNGDRRYHLSDEQWRMVLTLLGVPRDYIFGPDGAEDG